MVTLKMIKMTGLYLALGESLFNQSGNSCNGKFFPLLKCQLLPTVCTIFLHVNNHFVVLSVL